MTDTIPAEILVPRDEALVDLKAAYAHARWEESDRNKISNMKTDGLMLVTGLSVVFAGFELARDLTRPQPKDHFDIAIMRADNTIEALVERDSLPPDKRDAAIDNTIIRFAGAWEGYVFRANQANYNMVSAVTAGEPLRRQYQSRFVAGTPGNVDEAYGPDVTRDVPAMEILKVPAAPYARDVRMLVRIKRPNAVPSCQRWVARLSFKDDDPKHPVIPRQVQTVFDPMDLIFVSYDSHVDPTAPGVFPCG